jgi:hypothetical protein
MHHPGGQRIEVHQRDAEIRELARLVEARAKQAPLQLLCVETLIMSPTFGTTYDRAVVFLDSDARPRNTFQMVPAHAVDAHRWLEIHQKADTLLNSTARRGPEFVVFDLFEAMIISLYDGSAWKSSTWLYLSLRTESDPERPEDLSAETRAAVNLIQLLNWTEPERTRHFAADYEGMIEKFGEYPSGEMALPRRTRK